MGVAGHGTLCLLRCGNALSEIKTGVTSPVPKENMYVNTPTMAIRINSFVQKLNAKTTSFCPFHRLT